ncbi:ATPase domain-containing protein [Sorangium sp. So ce302]|uniref:ATPase domain-containing protein n=1 Tax=Sorangium sp. So ce302 TaxID=3133297 RepID=UPI003F648032
MLESGVPNLDRLLGGGVPEGDVILVMGPPGSGKTTLSLQIAFRAASSNKNVAYVSTLSEPPARLARHLRSFSFFDESRIGKQLFLLHVYPIVKEGLDRTLDALIAAVKDHRASLLVIDGLDTIRDLHAGTAQIRTFIYELAVALAGLECTTIITSTGSGRLEPGAGMPPELTMSDCIILLAQMNVGTQAIRTVQVQKVRGRSPMLGVHTMRLGPDGVSIFPRIEALTVPSDSGLHQERLPLGQVELDKMLSGGLPRGSVTLLAGAPGTGKTLVGLQYILDGARRGEKGLIVGYRESPSLLVDKVRAFGMDLATPIEQGLVRVLHRVPIDTGADELLCEMLREIEDFGPKRLALDSIAEIEQAVPDERRRRSVLTCFAEVLRTRDVTALVTREIRQVTGPELDFSDSPLASLGENLILLRYVEFRSELYRILSILKMRDTAHDRTIRQYEISNDGLRVLAAMESGEEVLSGIARMPSELRVKRSAPSSMGGPP